MNQHIMWWAWLGVSLINGWTKFGGLVAFFLAAIMGLVPYSLGLLW